MVARVASVMIQSNISHGLRMAALGFKKTPLARIWVKRGEEGEDGGMERRGREGD